MYARERCEGYCIGRAEVRLPQPGPARRSKAVTGPPTAQPDDPSHGLRLTVRTLARARSSRWRPDHSSHLPGEEMLRRLAAAAVAATPSHHRSNHSSKLHRRGSEARGGGGRRGGRPSFRARRRPRATEPRGHLRQPRYHHVPQVQGQVPRLGRGAALSLPSPRPVPQEVKVLRRHGEEGAEGRGPPVGRALRAAEGRHGEDAEGPADVGEGPVEGGWREGRGAEAHGVGDRGRAAGPAAVEHGDGLEEGAVGGVLGEVLEEEERTHAGLAEVAQTVGVHRLQAAGLELHLHQDSRVERFQSVGVREDGHARMAYSVAEDAILPADGEVPAVGRVEQSEITDDSMCSHTLWYIIFPSNQIHVALRPFM